MKLVDKDNPILRKKAKPVTKFSDDVLELADEMFSTLENLEGVGLAAVQVGKDQSLAIIEYTRKKDEDPKEVKDIPKTVLINPSIIWSSKDKELQTEACFSLPKIEIDVPRYKKIHIGYQNEEGKRKKLKVKGFLARAIQHEIDHLNGILITDYL